MLPDSSDQVALGENARYPPFLIANNDKADTASC